MSLSKRLFEGGYINWESLPDEEFRRLVAEKEYGMAEAETPTVADNEVILENLTELAKFLAHMHEDIARVEESVDHATQGIGLILAAVHPDCIQIDDDIVTIRIPRKGVDNG